MWVMCPGGGLYEARTTGRYCHLSRHEARRVARDQAEWLWQQRYGR